MGHGRVVHAQVGSGPGETCARFCPSTVLWPTIKRFGHASALTNSGKPTSAPASRTSNKTFPKQTLLMQKEIEMRENPKMVRCCGHRQCSSNARAMPAQCLNKQRPGVGPTAEMAQPEEAAPLPKNNCSNASSQWPLRGPANTGPFQLCPPTALSGGWEDRARRNLSIMARK